MAISHTNYTGQVSDIGKEEPRQGNGDIVKDETHWRPSAAGLYMTTQKAVCHHKAKLPVSVENRLFCLPVLHVYVGLLKFFEI